MGDRPPDQAIETELTQSTLISADRIALSTCCGKPIMSIKIVSMGHPGFEPGTNRLKAECSTAELVTRAIEFRNVSYSNIGLPKIASPF